MSGEPATRHLPVMADAVVTMLDARPGRDYIDATVGGGGHAARILAASDPDGRLLGLDADGAAIARVAQRLGPGYGARLRLRQANFRALGSVAPAEGFSAADGCLFDLGLSSDQLADPERGFGIRTGGALDMRFDPSRGVPASSLLSDLDAGELAALFRRYGEEPFAGPIARAIVAARRTGRTEPAADLAAIVERAPPGRAPGRRRDHPATRVFQALRIAVNEELAARQEGLVAAVALLRPGGRLVVLSYHSLEDRVVKRFLRAERRGCTCPPEAPICICGRQPRLRLVVPKGLVPEEAEVALNPRARSARLRAAERLAA